MEDLLREKNICYPDQLLDPLFPFSLEQLPDGATELIVHPSTAGERWRRRDFEMLMDPSFRDALREGDIELISFSDLGLRLCA